MKLSSLIESKLDAPLRRTLIEASDDEPVAAVLFLEPAGSSPAGRPPHPSEFSSRAEYRQALIDRRRREIGAAHGAIRRSLEELQLHPHGGDLTHAVAVQGKARQLVAAMESPSIQRAILDREISRPIPESAVADERG